MEKSLLNWFKFKTIYFMFNFKIFALVLYSTKNIFDWECYFIYFPLVIPVFQNNISCDIYNIKKNNYKHKIIFLMLYCFYFLPYLIGIMNLPDVTIFSFYWKIRFSSNMWVTETVDVEFLFYITAISRFMWQKLLDKKEFKLHDEL